MLYVHDLRETKKILGMKITRDRSTGRLSPLTGHFKLSFKHFILSYVDADYAGDLDHRRSTTDYVFTVVSTTEAEYIAAVEALKEAL